MTIFLTNKWNELQIDMWKVVDLSHILCELHEFFLIGRCYSHICADKLLFARIFSNDEMRYFVIAYEFYSWHYFLHVSKSIQYFLSVSHFSLQLFKQYRLHNLVYWLWHSLQKDRKGAPLPQNVQTVRFTPSLFNFRNRLSYVSTFYFFIRTEFIIKWQPIRCGGDYYGS